MRVPVGAPYKTRVHASYVNRDGNFHIFANFLAPVSKFGTDLVFQKYISLTRQTHPPWIKNITSRHAGLDVWHNQSQYSPFLCCSLAADQSICHIRLCKFLHSLQQPNHPGCLPALLAMPPVLCLASTLLIFTFLSYPLSATHTSSVCSVQHNIRFPEFRLSVLSYIISLTEWHHFVTSTWLPPCYLHTLTLYRQWAHIVHCIPHFSSFQTSSSFNIIFYSII